MIIEEEGCSIPRLGWTEIIRKIYEVNLLFCPKCQGRMHIIAFITDYSGINLTINHFKLTFTAEKPPPPNVIFQEV